MLLSPATIDAKHLKILQPDSKKQEFILEITNCMNPSVREFERRVKAENSESVCKSGNAILITFSNLEELNNLRAEMYYANWPQDTTLGHALFMLSQYCVYVCLKMTDFTKPISALSSTSYLQACDYYRHDISMLWYFENNIDYPHASYHRDEAEDKIFATKLSSLDSIEGYKPLATYVNSAIFPSARSRGKALSAWLQQVIDSPIWLQLIKIKAAKTQHRFISPRFFSSSSTTFGEICKLEKAILAYTLSEIAKANGNAEKLIPV